VNPHPDLESYFMYQKKSPFPEVDFNIYFVRSILLSTKFIILIAQVEKKLLHYE